MNSLVLLLCALAPATAFGVAAPVRTPFPFHATTAGAAVRTGGIVARSWTPADMSSKALPLPEDLESLLSAATDRKTTSQLWAAFRSCYATEGDAIEAAKRNTGTILPYLNSPGNIYGSYEYLAEILGVEGAQEVCRQNPGVLQCDPRALRQTTGESIVRAAKAVDAFESVKLPPVVRAAHAPRLSFACGTRLVRLDLVYMGDRVG